MTALTRWLDAAATEATEAASANSLESMADMLDLFMLVLMVGLGLYMIYTGIRLKKECVLFDNKILYPSRCTKEECLDPDGFIEYISPRLLAFGVFLLLCGGFCALVTWVPAFNLTVLVALELALPLAAVVWYGFIIHKAAKAYWGI